MNTDEFDAVRAEKDPIRQARHATELLAVYANRSTELARLRKAAVERAYDQGMTYTQIAEQVGLTKGRITQLRRSAPPEERAFFGVGPVTIAVPVRPVPDRPHGMIALEDSTAAERLTDLLTSLAMAAEPFQIPPDGQWTPPHDAVAICGPKSSPVTAEAIRADPYLTFAPDSTGRWVVTDRATGEVYVSPSDSGDQARDIAYVARFHHEGRTVLFVAGVHALGSIGAVEYLRRNLTDLYAKVGHDPFSLIVASTFDGTTVTDTAAAWGPKAHP